MPIFLLFGKIPSYLSFLGQNWFEHPSSWGSPSAQVIWLLGYLVEILMQRPLLSSYPCSSYWVIWLFGKNLVSYPSPSYWVIWLFGRNFILLLSLSKLLGYMVIWLFGKNLMWKLLLIKPSLSKLLGYLVIWLFGKNLMWKLLLISHPCPSYWVIWLFGKNLMWKLLLVSHPE